VDQITELQKNLLGIEEKVAKDREWLWRTDPVREKKARYGLGLNPLQKFFSLFFFFFYFPTLNQYQSEHFEAPSTATMTNEDWKTFKGDSRVGLLIFSLLTFRLSAIIFFFFF